MSSLSNEIERFIKDMFEEGEDSAAIGRNELADYFHCAPSQINYVLSTRFSPQNGYITESRRGGGGYIKVIKINVNEHDYLQEILDGRLAEGISVREVRQIAEGLQQTGLIDEAHKKTIIAALSDKSMTGVDLRSRGRLRAQMLRQILLSLLT